MKIQSELKEWFDVPGDEDGARIQIKCLIPKQLREINKKATSTTYKQSVGKDDMESHTKVESDRITHDIFMACVVNWEKFENDGGEIPCDKKWKQIMYDTVTGLDAFVMNCHNELSKRYTNKVELEEKN